MCPARVAALTSLGFAAVLAGCAAGPDYVPPALPDPQSFSTVVNRALLDRSAAAVIGHWWTLLGDPELSSLIDRAVASNPRIEIALDRIKTARATEVAVVGVALPAVDASVGAGKGTGSNSTKGRVTPPLNAATSTTGLTQITTVAGFDAGWELDLFGKHRRAIEVARYATDLAVEQRRDILVSVVAEVARAYIDVRRYQHQERIAQDAVKRARETLKLVKTRFDRGLTNELDVALASRQLAAFESNVPGLRAKAFEAATRIALLTETPSQSVLAELDKPRPIPRTPERVKVGFPAEVLRRRPDIRAAERDLALATGQIGVAAADLFPRVGITAGGGVQNQGLGVSPVVWKNIYSMGPTLYWPLLDFGTLDALVQAQEGRAHAQYVTFKDIVLKGVEEANLSIVRYQAQMAALQVLGRARTESRRSLELATERYDRGLTDFLNVLDAERQEDDLNIQFASAAADAAIDFVGIYKALGGGWEMYDISVPNPSVRPAMFAAFQHMQMKMDEGEAGAIAR